MSERDQSLSAKNRGMNRPIRRFCAVFCNPRTPKGDVHCRVFAARGMVAAAAAARAWMRRMKVTMTLAGIVPLPDFKDFKHLNSDHMVKLVFGTDTTIWDYHDKTVDLAELRKFLEEMNDQDDSDN